MPYTRTRDNALFRQTGTIEGCLTFRELQTMLQEEIEWGLLPWHDRGLDSVRHRFFRANIKTLKHISDQIGKCERDGYKELITGYGYVFLSVEGHEDGHWETQNI